ncbi:Lrp/AsnC family transcriptional regulator [Umezawaea beigongshangensis]|uniref:Lrp/AsnC family transcriptional regulator n=1 Tax=Umezawaea beigongshangensis TaxID=2780383 RepID=UPI0018F1E429|nr:Lrp/AsnC family transcriptional regulator [Umezawaea beigongshangensis]
MAEIDRLDAEIIGRLTVDSRMSVAELSAHLGVTRSTVQARLKRLEDTGVLGGFRPELDLDRIGVHVQAFVAIELDQKRLGEVTAALARVPEVLEVVTQAGREDLVARVASSTHKTLQEVVTVIIDLPGVRHTTTTLAVSTPVPYRLQPLLDKLTEGRGWGRSTPGPL